MTIPRNAQGWPTIEPEYFTLPQLIREAIKWHGSGYTAVETTVAGANWKKYTDELVRRNFSTEVEIAHGILPHRVQRTCEPCWMDQLVEDEELWNLTYRMCNHESV